MLSKALGLRWFKTYLKRQRESRSNVKNAGMLHHDNAPCYTAISIDRSLALKNTHVAPQPSYSHDSSPSEIYPLSMVKNSPQRTTFSDTSKKYSNACDRPIDGYSSIPNPEPVIIPSAAWISKAIHLKATTK